MPLRRGPARCDRERGRCRRAEAVALRAAPQKYDETTAPLAETLRSSEFAAAAATGAKALAPSVGAPGSAGARMKRPSAMSAAPVNANTLATRAIARGGAVALDAFTSRWVSERMRTVSRENDLTGTERTWEARQARAGARRITRVFRRCPAQ